MKNSVQKQDDHRFTITDLISLERLQTLQDAFAISNGVASTITDTYGVPITKPSNHCGVCKLIRESPQGLQNCIMSGKELGNLARKQRKPINRKCMSIGFSDAVAPIIINDLHIANWLVGQYHVRDVDEKRIRNYALEISIDPDRLFDEFTSMVKIPASLFESKLIFLEVMANELSEMAYLHLAQKHQNEELILTKTKLEKFQKNLENTIEERTVALKESNKKLEEEILIKNRIEQEQKKLITAIDSSAESIVITSPDGIILYTNPAFETLTGFTRQEVLGKKPNLLKSGFHDEPFYKSLWQTITSGKTWSGIMTNRKKTGTLYKEESTITPVIDGNGIINNYVAIKRDITRELEIQEELRRAQRLESIGTLAAGIAHEINTPLQYLVSNTLFLKDALADLFRLQDEYGTLVETARKQNLLTENIQSITQIADEIELDFLSKETEITTNQTLDGLDRISEIINAMRDFTRPDNDSKSMQDITSLIKNVLTVSRSKWTNLTDIEVELSETLPQLYLYPNEFSQMILNMLLNSVQAIEERYNSGDQHKGIIKISATKMEKSVEITIYDNGTGIARENIEKVFDPFFTTKPVDQGRGQSLSTAYNYVTKKLNGTISVSSSRQDKWTMFTISIPQEFRS